MRMEDVDFAFATCEKSPLRNSSGPRTNVSLRGSGLKPGQTNFESFSPYFVEWKQQHDHGHPQTSLELYGIPAAGLSSSATNAFPLPPTAGSHRPSSRSYPPADGPVPHPDPQNSDPPAHLLAHAAGYWARPVHIFIHLFFTVRVLSLAAAFVVSLPPSLAIAARTSTPRRPAARSPPPSPHLPPLLYPGASRRNRNEVAVGDGGRVENGSWRDATAARFQPRIQLQPVSDDPSASSFTCVPVPGIAVVIGGVWVRIDWVVLVRARGV
jgi:hypothetical protein